MMDEKKLKKTIKVDANINGNIYHLQQKSHKKYNTLRLISSDLKIFKIKNDK